MSASQTLIPVSVPPLASTVPSGDQATDSAFPAWLSMVRTGDSVADGTRGSWVPRLAIAGNYNTAKPYLQGGAVPTPKLAKTFPEAMSTLKTVGGERGSRAQNDVPSGSKATRLICLLGAGM